MGWRDAPIVDERPQAPASAWQSAPVVGGEAQPPGPAPRVPITTQQVTEGPPGSTPEQFQEGPPGTRLEQPRTFRQGAELLGDIGLGIGETALATATGGGAEILAGLAGIEELVRGGPDSLERAARRIEEVQNLRTFQPRTEMGQRIMQGLGLPFQRLIEGAERAGGATLEATGSPAAATAVSTGLQLAPALVGVRRPPVGRAQRAADVERIETGARELGVGLNEGVTPQRQQIEAAGERMAAGGEVSPTGQPIIPERGQAIPGVQQAMQAEAEKARQWKNSLYEQAKQTDARVKLDDAVGLADRLDAVRNDFIVSEMPRARKLLNEADQLRRLQQKRDELIAEGGNPREISITINQMEEWGKKVRRNQPDRRADPAQHAAMERMLRIKDDFMDELFNADMISGDQDAIAAWRRARAANQSYRERFSDNKVIRDMVEMEADPETVRKWIFGANAAGAKTEAASVVRRIKNELGEDSPQFTALRQEAVLDILDPILGPDPNLKGFVRRYDNFVGRNRTLARELFGENLQGLTNLRDLAQAHRERPIVAISELPGGARILGVAAFGHELARKALTVRAGSTAATILARTATKSPRRRLMGSILGYDPFQPMFGGTSLAALAASRELGNPPEEQGPLSNLPAGQRQSLERLRGGP